MIPHKYCPCPEEDIFGSKGQGQHAEICILNIASLPHRKCSLTIIF